MALCEAMPSNATASNTISIPTLITISSLVTLGELQPHISIYVDVISPRIHMSKTQLLIFTTSLPNFSSLFILENGAQLGVIRDPFLPPFHLR